MKAFKYLDKAKLYRNSRWAAIGMCNLADEVPVEDIPALLPTLRAIAVAEVQRRVDKLTELRAPLVILEMEVKKLNRAKAGSAPIEAILRRSLNRRSAT